MVIWYFSNLEADMRYFTRILPVAVVALVALTFADDASAGRRRQAGCGCCESVAASEAPAPAVAQNPGAARTERSFSVEPSTEYVPQYRSGRSSSRGAYGLDYTQRQRGYSSR